MTGNQGKCLANLANDVADMKANIVQILKVVTDNIKTEQPPTIDLPLSSLQQVEELEVSLRNSDEHCDALVSIVISNRHFLFKCTVFIKNR